MERILRCCFGLLLCGLLSSCDSSNQSPHSSYTLPNGLKVQSVPIEQSDLAQVIDLMRWRFNVTVPPAQKDLFGRLELHRKDGTVEDMGGVGISGFGANPVPVLVGLFPTNGDFTKADRLKSFVRIGGGIGSRVVKNPFKSFSSTATGEAVCQKDGGLLLLLGRKSQSAMWPQAESNDLALYLKLDNNYVKLAKSK